MTHVVYRTVLIRVSSVHRRKSAYPRKPDRSFPFCPLFDFRLCLSNVNIDSVFLHLYLVEFAHFILSSLIQNTVVHREAT